jgi:O-antigen ligase
MKKLLLIEDTPANKISYYHIMLMLVTLPFDQFFSHVVLLSFALHTLFHVRNVQLKKLLTKPNIIMQSVFYVTLISLVYTKYPALAGIDITRQLAILLFPVLFSLSTFNFSKYRDNLLYVFAIVCALTIIGLYSYAFYIIHYFKLPLKAIFSDLFINHKFSAPINMHATFFSLQIAVAFFYVLTRFINTAVLKHKIYFLILGAILLAGLIQLGSKAVFVVMLIGLIAIVPYFLIAANKRLKYVLITSVLAILVIGAALSVNSFKERYVTDLKTDLSEDPTENESVEPRIVRWQVAMELVKKHPLIGYGAGSELKILGDEYFKDKLYISYLSLLNAHNQYITFLLVTGTIGLLVYVFTLFFGFKTAWQQKDTLFLIFMLLIAMVSLSESLLNAEKGVYFYSFFFSFFIFSARANPAKSNLIIT